VFLRQEPFHHLERGEVGAVVRRDRDLLVLQHLRRIDAGVAAGDDREFRHRGTECDDLASAASFAVRFDRAFHDAPFAHPVLIDAALVVGGVERTVEHRIELHGVRGGHLRHPGRGDELDIEPLVFEKPQVARHQHRQVMNRVHDRDLVLSLRQLLDCAHCSS
jgi:hypothetical protein